MYKEDKELLTRIAKAKNLTQNTINNYQSAINKYTTHCGKSMVQLLDEAEQEEEDGIRWKRRKIRKHLIEYRASLIDEYEYEGTIRVYLQKILAIYRHYEIELQPLPQVSTRNKNQPNLNYTDLPDKGIIRRAVNLTDPKMRALILFMTSSGTGRTETLNLTIQDFITATSEYHNKKDIYEVLEELDPNTDIIPTWRIHRQKTNKDYYTFSSPESSRAIIYYLENKENRLTSTSRLFDYDYSYLGKKFSQINRKLDLGSVGKYHRFRSHMLRKYHASQLSQGENALTLDEIDALQGRSKEKTRQSYFLNNPDDLKRKYARNINQLLILEEVKQVENEEYYELKKKYEKLEANIKEAAREEVRRILLDLGYEL